MTLGLASKVGEVASAAGNLASKALGGAKGILGIHSPSTEFYKIGEQSAEGLSNAFDDDKTVQASAANMVDNITAAFTNSLGQIPDSLANMDAFNPTITPVLDLTKVQSQSSGISDALGAAIISPTVSSAQAALISSSTTAAAAASAANQPSTEPTSIIFEQTINAPTELSTNDIYRNTKSQITLAKEELGIS
jgi:hypothetical protein